MHEFTHTTNIAASPETVWRALAEFEHYAQWNPYIPRAAGKLGVGNVIALQVRLGDRTMAVKQKVTELDPGRSWAWVSHSWYTLLATGGLRRFTVEPMEDGGCRLIDYECVSGPFAKYVERRYAEAMRQGMKAQGAALKAWAERGATPALAPPEVRLRGPADTLRLLRRLMFDPIRLIEELRDEHGEVFTVPMPFGITPPFTFLTTRAGYNSVLRLDASVGRNGPVIDRVPALARWTPRSDRSDAHLQTLLLLGRRYIGERLHACSPSSMRREIAETVAQHVDAWAEELDLASVLVTAIHDVSARLLLGADLWRAFGHDALDHLRTIVNAVDAARAAVALSPAATMLPEYEATLALSARLLDLAEDPDSSRYAFIEHLRRSQGSDSVPPEDVAWMLFFAGWNATLYTGTYGLWSFLDLLDHPQALAEVRDPGPERTELLTGGLLETMRKNPISWQLRALAKPVVVDGNGSRYSVPSGHFLTVCSHGLNHDPALYPDPQVWNPRRYLEGAPQPLLFGAGPFGCVAQRWVKTLIATVHAELLDRLELRLLGPLPQRRSRVHLLYPQTPVLAAATRRATKTSIAA